MRKILKKWADGLGIYFNKEEIKTENLQEGNIVEVEANKVSILFKDKEKINWKDLREKIKNE